MQLQPPLFHSTSAARTSMNTNQQPKHNQATMKRTQDQATKTDAKKPRYCGTTVSKNQKGVKIEQQHSINMPWSMWQVFTKSIPLIEACWDSLEEGRFELGGRMYVTLSKFQEKVLLHIRCWDLKEETKWIPSKFGVWFTRETWVDFLNKISSIADLPVIDNWICSTCHNDTPDVMHHCPAYQRVVDNFCASVDGQLFIASVKEAMSNEGDIPSRAYFGVCDFPKEEQYRYLSRSEVLQHMSKDFLLVNSALCYLMTSDEHFNFFKDYIFAHVKSM